MNREVLVAVLVTILVDELTGVSRWVADKVARWAARRIYLSDAERARERAEEWHALVSETIPTNFSALCFGLGLGAAALAHMTIRRVTALASAARRALRLLPGTEDARRERHITERRAACLSLMQEASELRLLAANPGTDIGRIRQQAAHIQVQAARVALLAPDSLAESAERLAVAASLLADATTARRNVDDDPPDPPVACQELDQSIRAFWRAAVDMFRDLLRIGSGRQ